MNGRVLKREPGRILVAPSLLAADFTRLREEIESVESAGCDWLHIDVMDGHFVPNLTLGPFILEAIRKVTQLPLDVHLMIESPWKSLKDFRSAGADILTVHTEACGERLEETLGLIRSLGAGVGASVRPDTEIDVLIPWLDRIDLVLIMTVYPGFGGQKFMPEVLPKLKSLRSRFHGFLEVDGGIGASTAHPAIAEGADVLVAGTAVFGQPDRKKAIASLRS